MKDITNKLKEFIDEKYIYINEPMSKHTSFKIGGNADWFIKVKSETILKKLLEFVQKNKIQYYIIGNGTNLLVTDKGIRGIVIKLELDDYVIGKQDEYAYITVGSGMTLTKLALIAYENGLSGLECLAGIPGTVGGAIRMNAGAFGKEMKDIVIFSKCIDNIGIVKELRLVEHKFSYRESAFINNGLIVLETTIKLKYSDKEKIKQKMDECKKLRVKNQPLDFPNAGSTFKRNSDIPTSKLIDDCGLKGYKVGDAEISTKHAGFIVNKGNATASDVIAVSEHVKKVIKQKYNKNVELEILVIGEK